MNVLHLFRRLQASWCVPTVTPDCQLVSADRLPADLILCILPKQIGLLTILTGRPWYFTAIPGLHRAGGQLDPNMLIPEAVHLLTDGGDDGCDTVLVTWHDRCPDIFDDEAEGRMNANPSHRLELVYHATFRGVKYLPLGVRWLLMFTVGTEATANRMTLHFYVAADGDWRNRRSGRAAA